MPTANRVSCHASRITQHATRNTLLLLTLLAALFLRVYRLDQVPAGVDYDEAGNFILAQEIATGKARPVFIRAYAGREAVFYWMAAASMRLLGRNLFAFRLTAALCGVGTVLFAYLLGREIFHQASPVERQWVPLLGAATMAVSYWHVHISRYGFRVNAMTLLLAATMTFLWRGLRRNRWLDLGASGVLCGLAANTYLAIRAFPLVLLGFAAWVILAWRPEGSGAKATVVGRRWRWLRVRQFVLFGLAALVALAPLGIFFLRNPEFFSTRMSQTSIFDPEVHGGDLWGTLSRVTVDALGIFTVRGDGNPVYNLDRRPIFGPLLGLCFYLGLLACLWRVAASCGPQSAGHDLRARTPYLLILTWLLVMLLPNILGARGVPHSLRSMGMMPVVYYVPALGLLAALQAVWRGIERIIARLIRTLLVPDHNPARLQAGRRGIARLSDKLPNAPKWASSALAIVLLVAGGAQTYHRYFNLWTQDPEAYYRSAVDVRRAAEYLGQWDADQVTLWVSNDTYRHTTIAAFCANYSQLKWFNGATLVLPVESDRPSLYVFDHTNPLDPLLAHYLPPDTLQHRELGPDGNVGFEAYLVPVARLPSPQPQFRTEVNLGHTIALIGYDVNRPPVSGAVLDVTLYWRILQDGSRSRLQRDSLQRDSQDGSRSRLQRDSLQRDSQDGGQDDWTFFAHLVDDLGFRWGGETFFHYPSSQWRAGEVVLFRKRMAIAPGAPPGQYALTVGVFAPSLDARLPVLNQDGQMVGTTVQVGPFDVAPSTTLPEDLPPIQQPLAADFGHALTLLGSDRDRGDLRPRETLALSLYWQSTAEIGTDYTVSLWLEGENERIPLWQGDPVHGRYPFSKWQASEFVRDRYALRLPTDAPAGDYDLRLALLRPDGTPVPTSDGAEWLSLSTIHVHASERLWEPPPFARSVGARLGDKVELVGYDLDREEAKPGDTIHLTLVWRCLNQMEGSYTVFTHLLDEGEQVRGQKDNPPVQGRYATTLWVPGEVVVDEYDIVVHGDAPPGTYAIEVGMYDPTNMQRLPAFDPAGTVGDRILLGKVQIREISK